MTTIGYVTILNAIVSYLQSNKTTLNNNLTSGKTFTANTQFIIGDPITTPIMRGRYPFIWVGLSSKDEDFAGIGSSGNKDAIMTSIVYPAVTIRKDKADTLTELYNLSDNIEGLFRDNIDIDDAVLWANISSTDFFIEDKERTFVAYAAISIDLNIRVE
jgi:hypothetical protein